MANKIKLKRGSGSDPSASDLEVGELAIRTDSGKIFTKKDNGSVAEISGGGGIDDGDKGDITVSNGGDTFVIDNGVITSAKIADGAIALADMGASSVGTSQLVAGAVTNDKVSSSAAIAGSKIANDSITATQIANDSITANELSNNSVGNSHIIDGTITNSEINGSAAIAGTKISPDFGSQNISTTGGLLIGDTTAMNANFGAGVLELSRSGGAELVLRRKDTSIGANNSLARIEIMGNDPDTSAERVGAVMAFSCPTGQSWSGSNHVTNFTLSTCKPGSTTRTTSFFVGGAGNKDHNVLIGNASGSNMENYYLGIRGNENSSDGDSTNQVNFGILNQSQSSSAQSVIDFRLGQASISNTTGVRLIAGKMSGWNNTASTRDGNFKIQVANNATLTTRLYINNAGRVGLGNIAPSETLDVTGNIAVSGTVDGVDIAARNTLFGGLTSSSGVLTNGVTATTQSASDNSTKVATTAYTDTAISNLVDSSPSTLNTLNELAAALGDDANFSTTVTNSIATKLPLAGGTLTGSLGVTGDITCTSDLILDSTNTDYPRITLHSNATGIRKYAIINGQGWNQDALLIYDLDGDNTRLTI